MCLANPRLAACLWLLLGLFNIPLAAHGQIILAPQENPIQPFNGQIPGAPPGVSAPNNPAAPPPKTSSHPGAKSAVKPGDKGNASGKPSEKGKPGEKKTESEKKSATTTRPEKPESPPAPNELKVRPDDEARFNFSSAASRGPMSSSGWPTFPTCRSTGKNYLMTTST